MRLGIGDCGLRIGGVRIIQNPVLSHSRCIGYSCLRQKTLGGNNNDERKPLS
jgi:hypothetical protein